MSQPEKDHRRIVLGDEATADLLEGARRIYESVGVTYGPRGLNAALEKPFGRAVHTRDGVTVARETYFKERGIQIGAADILEASETTNRIAGDGTSATVILGYHLVKQGVQAIAAGTHPMELRDILNSDSNKLLDKLDSLSKPVKKGQLKSVATVSSGDPLLGQLIAEAIEYVGPDGGIVAEKYHSQGVEREYVDGYYLDMGFDALQTGRKEINSPVVIVSIKRLSSLADAAELLTKAVTSLKLTPQDLQQGNIPRFLLIGNIEDMAYNVIVDNINRGQIDAIIVKAPPSYGAMNKQLLEDIAIYAGCEPITDTTNLKMFNESYLGTVDRVVTSKTETTLFRSSTGETIEDRVSEIKDLLENEPVDQIAEKYQDRIAKLQGKIALFRIGAPTETAKEEIEFRVEDAIQATRAAANDGVVAGGGVTWLELSKLPVSDIYKNSLHAVFQKLLTNANLPSELKLDEALKAPVGHGFNLRKGGELVNVIEEGVLDPTLVLRQVIINATSAAINILTNGVLVLFEDKKEE